MDSLSETSIIASNLILLFNTEMIKYIRLIIDVGMYY